MISTTTSVHPSPSCTSDSRIQWDLTPSSITGESLLRLSGDLKPGWLGRLSSHLSHRKINIMRGTARKCGPLCWESSFEIQGRRNLSDPIEKFDPLPAIMGSAAQVELPQLKISDFKVEHSTHHNGSIYTEITGGDCIGFLYGILRTFSFYSLFPTELEIATTGKTAHDRFWLKGIGASVPTEEDLNTLHGRLSLMLSNSKD
ncbi:hypothetical protein [Geobacter sp. SVR]|uniref:hypothetical protein n=1 Tax=Geobacter sp. SVR TaxID=2495594 RepID=UPI00143F03CA|nr:hypothetical protein [Geobacter sp. SVR]BCS52565.1 hypothetical protein GSVR_08730 [Geobacter sp. SVR]GCF83997.1 hypothetical protein GSbR_05970 [Geobacter sp. SVR]